MAKKKMNSDDNQHSTDGVTSVFTAESIENTQWAKWRNNSTGGHGFAAEDANAQNDRFHFNKVETVGHNSQKDGADRIVHNMHGKTIAIQTKYYQTAEQSVGAAFNKETGLYRYSGQILEVPKEQYENAVREMAHKISAGKVPGMTDPLKAESLIRQGDVTYTQSKNIAKAGNIDSLKFDVKEQCTTTGCVMGLSFVVSFANCKWNGMDNKQALRFSGINAFKCGGVAMGAGIVARQLLRTQLGRNFAAFSTKSAKTIVNQIYKTDIGKDVIHKLATRIAGKALTGVAAKNFVAKLARTEWPVIVCITAATTLPDLYRASISKEISWSQFTKDLGVNVFSAIGGVGGATAGAILGSFIFPGAGTVIGAIFGLAGGVGGGMGTGKLASFIADVIHEDDATQMNRIIQNIVPQLSSDFLISQDEFTKISEEIQTVIDTKWLRKMYHAGVQGKSPEDKAMFQSEYAYTEFSPLFEKIIAKREVVIVPSDKDICKDLRKINLRLFIEFFKQTIKGLFYRKRSAVN